MPDQPVDIWRGKLEFLQREEAIAIGAEKFAIQKQIEEAKQKIGELEAATAESLDKALLAYSEVRLAEWNRAWTNPDDPDRLVYYVPPHYALVKARSNC